MPSITAAKQEYEERLNNCFNKYSKVLFVGMENVRSQQVHDVRAALRGKAEFVMGKKTLQAKIVEKRSNCKGATEDSKQFHEACENNMLLRGNSGLIFTNEDAGEIMAILESFRVKAPARVGAIAPCDVVVPAGNTGMEPTQTSFFQALNIATKISKGTVEIISDKKVLSVGDKVDNSTATLLQKLNISPFFYQAEVLSVWDRGVLFTKDDLKTTDDVVEKFIIEGISNISAMSLGAGIPTASTIGPMVMDAFKNLLGASIATAYEFPEFDGKSIREAAKNGTLAGAAAAAPAAAAPAGGAAKAEAKKEETEEDDDDLMGGLF